MAGRIGWIGWIGWIGCIGCLWLHLVVLVLPPSLPLPRRCFEGAAADHVIVAGLVKGGTEEDVTTDGLVAHLPKKARTVGG